MARVRLAEARHVFQQLGSTSDRVKFGDEFEVLRVRSRVGPTMPLAAVLFDVAHRTTRSLLGFLRQSRGATCGHVVVVHQAVEVAQAAEMGLGLFYTVRTDEGEIGRAVQVVQSAPNGSSSCASARYSAASASCRTICSMCSLRVVMTQLTSSMSHQCWTANSNRSESS